MTSSRIGSLLAASAALCAAAFLLPFKLVGELAPRGAVVTAVLLCAAIFCSFSLVVRRRHFRVTARFITAAQATLLGLSSPLFALGLFALALGTLPSTAEITGGVLILLGVAVPLFQTRASDSLSKNTK